MFIPLFVLSTPALAFAGEMRTPEQLMPGLIAGCIMGCITIGFAIFALKQYKKRKPLHFWAWLICFGLSIFLGTFPGDIFDGYMRAKGEIYFFSDGFRVSYFIFIFISLAVYFIGKKFVKQDAVPNLEVSVPNQTQTDESP